MSCGLTSRKKGSTRRSQEMHPGANDTSICTIPMVMMDQVYRLSTNRRRGEFHSAGVLLTGLFLTGVFAQWLWLGVPVWLLKLGLYLRRHHRYPLESKPLFFSRIAFGFVLPIAAFTNYPLAIAFILVGELIDRVEFYLELDFAQPSTQMRADLERAMV